MNIIKHDRCEDVGFVIKKIEDITEKGVNLDGYWVYLKTNRFLVEDKIFISSPQIEFWQEI